MSDLAGLIAIAADNTASEVHLSPNTLAVLLYALGKIEDERLWADYRGEVMPEADIETIHDLVDEAAYEVMNPIMASPAGSIVMWTEVAPPARWLVCDGSQVLVADYPELFALWGYKYGGSGANFGLPNMDDYSPMGSGGNVVLDGTAGEINHTLTVNEIPAHTHTILLRGSGTASGTINRINAPAQTTLASNVVTDAQGGGSPHNNLHPVYGVRFIVYGGME